MGRFSNKVVLVTGSGKGIGRASAEAFATEGASVVLVSRTAKELESTKADIEKAVPGAKVLSLARDISEEKNVQEIFSKAEESLGPISILINNAALVKSGPVETLTVEDWDRVMATNVRGVFLCSRELFRRASQGKYGGAIVNISSLAGIRGTEKFPGLSSYVASKFAVVGLTEAFAVEGRKLGVRVNCIAPGAVNTELLRREAPHLKTKTEPSDIAKTVLYLASDEALSLSGSLVEIFSNL